MPVYDTAGNRATGQIDDAFMGASVDNVNRLVSQQPSGTIRVAGTLNEAASVTISGKAVDVDATNTFTGTASIAAGDDAFTVVATDPAGNSRTQIFLATRVGDEGRPCRAPPDDATVVPPGIPLAVPPGRSRIMPPSPLTRRVQILEEKVELLEKLPARIDTIELQILQFREDVRVEFSATRAEFLARIALTEGALLHEINQLDERAASRDAEARRFMRMLYEDAIARIATMGEGGRSRE